jgi:hypothetical protein
MPGGVGGGNCEVSPYPDLLEKFPAESIPSLDNLGEFTAAFYIMDVETLSIVKLAGNDITTRRNPKEEFLDGRSFYSTASQKDNRKRRIR